MVQRAPQRKPPEERAGRRVGVDATAAALRARDMGGVPGGLDGREPAIEFSHGRLDLLLADRVGGVLELAGQLGPREAKRLSGTELFGIHTCGQAAAAFFVFTRIELFLQSGFCIDEPFTSVTDSGSSSCPASGGWST